MTDWICETAPEGNSWHKLLPFLHPRNSMEVRSPFLDLVPTRTPKDIESLELEEPMIRSDHAVVRMQGSLQGLAALENCCTNFSGIDRIRLPDLGLLIWWEVKSGSKYVHRQRGAIMSNLLAITVTLVSLHRIKRRGLPPRWRSRITRTRKRRYISHEI